MTSQPRTPSSKQAGKLSRFLQPLRAAALLLLTASPLPAESPAPSSDNDAVLYSFFRHEKDGLYLAYCEKPLSFTELKSRNKTFFKPSKGIMRDPFIIRDPKQPDTYHMIWTTGWKEQTIGVAHSKDLIHWTGETYLGVMQSIPECINCWAPEMIYDHQRNEWLIVWASTITGRFTETEKENHHKGRFRNNNRLYCTTTKDFKSFSEPKLYYDPGYNVIDACIRANPDEGGFVMVVKDVTWNPIQKNLLTVKAKNLYGPWTASGEKFSGKEWAEGPSFLQFGKDWYIYWDKYMDKKIGASKTRDFVQYDDLSQQLDMPKGVRHGTIFRASRKVAKGLIEHSRINQQNQPPQKP